MAPDTTAAELRVYLAANGRTLLCRGCNQKALSANDAYHDICVKRVTTKAASGNPCADRSALAGYDASDPARSQHLRDANAAALSMADTALVPVSHECYGDRHDGCVWPRCECGCHRG